MAITLNPQSHLVDVGNKAVELKIIAPAVLNHICNGMVGPDDIQEARKALKSCLADSRSIRTEATASRARTAEELYGLLASSFPWALEAADQMVADAQRSMVRPALPAEMVDVLRGMSLDSAIDRALEETVPARHGHPDNTAEAAWVAMADQFKDNRNVHLQQMVGMRVRPSRS